MTRKAGIDGGKAAAAARLLWLGLLAAATASRAAAALELRAAKRTPHAVNHFVAVFRRDVHPALQADHLARHRKIAAVDPISEIRHTYNMSGFAGYAARLSGDHLKLVLLEDEILEYVEVDGVVSINRPAPAVDSPLQANSSVDNAPKEDVSSASGSCQTQSNAVWGLNRVSERDRKLDGQYTYGSSGENADVYVLDTGIYVDHEEFSGRAIWGTSFVGESSDGNGHGTHCAGTIAGTKYGVAKQASLVAVQVLSAQGSGSMSGVIAGIQWTCSRHQQRSSQGKKCVINLSLSGGYYDAMNAAANAAAQCGCAVVVAAGNDGSNACDKSPASASDAITVAATDSSDTRPYFSNIGACVTIFAPGVYIQSAWIGSKYALNAISGTSMAAPHVAGVAALWLAAGLSLPSTIKGDLATAASQGYVSGAGSGSPNLLLYNGGCVGR